MKKNIVLVVMFSILIAVIGGYAVAVLFLPAQNDKKTTETTTDSTTTAKADEKRTLEQTRKEREQQWESDMTAKVNFDVDKFEALALLNKWDLGYEKDDDGYALVPFSYESMPSEREARCKSAKKKGLTTHKISDAPGYCYKKLSKADVERIVKAEYGETITVDNLKGLSKEFRRKLLENPVLFEGFVNLTKDLHYGDAKSIRELNSWVDEFLDKYDKYREKEKCRGVNAWLKAVGPKDDPKPYMTDEYIEYAVWYISLFDGCEVNVEKLTSIENYHLVGGDRASCTKLTPATNQESEAALTFTYYFKDGTIGPKIASNLLDSRPELVEWRPPAKPSGKTPDGKPTPKHSKPSTKPPTPSSAPHSPKPGNDNNPGNPSPSIGTDESHNPEPDKSKDESEKPEDRPKDDKGPGEFEPEPKVPKSNSEEVDQSQHQPQADQKGGGTSTPREEITDPSAHQSEGGQIVTDPHTDNERTENAQASTDPIEAESRPDDSRNGDASQNGEFVLD